MFFPRISEATDVIHIEFDIVHIREDIVHASVAISGALPTPICRNQHWYNLKGVVIVHKFLDCSNIPQLLSAEAVLCTHKTASSASLVLEICPQFNNSYLNQFSSISGGNCIRLTVSSFDSQANPSNQSFTQRELLMPSPEVIDLTLSDDEIQPDPI